MAEAVPSSYRCEPLGKQHDRAAFSCGVEPLDRYFRVQAGQDAKSRRRYFFSNRPDVADTSGKGEESGVRSERSSP